MDSLAGEITVFHLGDNGYDGGELFSGAREVSSRVLPGLAFPAEDVFPR